METVFKDIQRRSITKKEEIPFTVKNSGLYAIIISARCKGEKQGIDADDEDLRIEMDERHFGELTNPNRYFDSPAAFAGGKLHNSKETIYFIFALNSGQHLLTLFPDKTATLESLTISKISSGTSLDQITIAQDITAEDGDRYPWIVFVFVDLTVSSMTLTLSLIKRLIDSDDVKVIIDGKTQRNFNNWFRRFWYFIANKDANATQSATFTPRLASGLHYIELWADRMPTIQSAQFVLSSSMLNKIQKYQPNKFNYDYNKLDEYILKATDFWNTFFLQESDPPLIALDPNLVKAILYRESRVGYYPDHKIIDVMQVWDPRNPSKDAILGKTSANEFINPKEIGHMKYSYPKSKVPPTVTTRENSIFWGIRWLYYKAQYLQEDSDGNLKIPYVRRWVTWRKAVENYNGNQELVEEYVQEVFSVYKSGIDLKGNVLWER